MECSKCDEPAVMHAAYSGSHLCERHFRESVERRVKRRIREDDLLPASATPSDPVTWVVGLSGGKDSTVLTDLLAREFADDPRVDIVALSIHEGIDPYRSESLDAARELVSDLDVEHVTVNYEDEYGVGMDRVADEDPLDVAPCAYCGVFRRDALSRFAENLEADVLLTGHNLDDEAQTALMNFLEGDVSQMARHFDASLGPLPERHEQEAFVPRAKPLRDVPEKEVALYAHLFDVPSHIAACPHADRAFRGEIRELLMTLEDEHPGTRHSIISGYEEMAKMAARRYRGTESPALEPCSTCGAPTTGDRCRKCQLLDEF
ncbi:MAG: TIGR00269 family protein [Halanaeroarchaeum sp.]